MRTFAITWTDDAGHTDGLDVRFADEDAKEVIDLVLAKAARQEVDE